MWSLAQTAMLTLAFTQTTYLKQSTRHVENTSHRRHSNTKKTRTGHLNKQDVQCDSEDLCHPPFTRISTTKEPGLRKRAGTKVRSRRGLLGYFIFSDGSAWSATTTLPRGPVRSCHTNQLRYSFLFLTIQEAAAVATPMWL